MSEYTADVDAEVLKRATALATAHWNFQRKWLSEIGKVPEEELTHLAIVYIDVFIHGYMHRVKEEPDMMEMNE